MKSIRQSQLFTKTRREAPKDEVSKNAELLIRAGFVHKDMTGVYSYLPLGLKVLKKIEEIIRKNMDAVGGQEMFLATLQSKELWEKTNRWDDKVVDNWFKTELKNGNELGLGLSHEEPLTNLMREYIRSSKDLPKLAYQFQNKFRNELRAKSGLMRGREFLMKDLYSFSKDEEQHLVIYEQVKQAYTNIYKEVGLGDNTFLTFASGGIFAPFSHEFQTLTDAGEDLIYLSREKGIAINKEVLNDEVLKTFNIERDELEEVKGVEVGNIFSLGTRFSSALELVYANEEGKRIPVIMGCYGIGLGRLMGAIVEVLADEKGIKWPKNVSPFHVHLLNLDTKNELINEWANNFFDGLTQAGVEVLYDDRDVRPGEKFNDADLIGIPLQVIIGARSFETGSVEIKNRLTGDSEAMAIDKIVDYVMNVI